MIFFASIFQPFPFFLDCVLLVFSFLALQTHQQKNKTSSFPLFLSSPIFIFIPPTKEKLKRNRANISNGGKTTWTRRCFLFAHVPERASSRVKATRSQNNKNLFFGFFLTFVIIFSFDEKNREKNPSLFPPPSLSPFCFLRFYPFPPCFLRLFLQPPRSFLCFSFFSVLKKKVAGRESFFSLWRLASKNLRGERIQREDEKGFFFGGVVGPPCRSPKASRVGGYVVGFLREREEKEKGRDRGGEKRRLFPFSFFRNTTSFEIVFFFFGFL